jgi:hypoxanthine phosphoribosyltransferase
MTQAIHDDLDKVLLTEDRIQRRVDELAAQIADDYAGKDLTVVPVLTGCTMFIADLLRRLTIPLRLDYIGVSSYRGGTRSTGEFVITKALQLDVRNRDVLVVDDILDTGMTLLRVQRIIQELQPRSYKVCALLEKDVPHQAGARADYIGFPIPNDFVVGYGLDYREQYRNLPFVATLKPEAIARWR